MMGVMKIKHLLGGVLLFAGVLTAEEPVLRSWAVDGVKREALIYFPGNVENPPLVFVFHGHGGSAKHAALSFRIHEVWPEAAVVYMQGLPTVGQLTDPEGRRNGWNADPVDPESRDLKFFDVVYESLKGRIDTNRVYCTGHSNGGSFTYCLWAARGSLFAAVAPSAALSVPAMRLMKPKPALHIAGTSDPVVKYAWQEKMIIFVRQLNGCADIGEPWTSSGDLTGTFYTSRTGTPLVTLVHSGGHRFDAAAPELIVRFFKEHCR